MAGILDSKMASGEKFGYRIESDDNTVTIKETHTISAETGKASSTITTENTVSYTSREDGSKISETSYIRSTEGKSTFSAPTSDESVSRVESSSTYGNGASSVDTSSEHYSSKSSGMNVDIEKRNVTAQNASGTLEKQEDSVTISKAKQPPEILANADYKVEELVLAEKGKSTSVEGSAWETKNHTAYENGYYESSVSVVDAEAHASAKATFGMEGIKADANAGASVTAVQTSEKVVFDKGHAEYEISLLNAEAHASAGIKISTDGFEASINVGVSTTVFEVDGGFGIGDGNLGVEFGADAKFLSASADVNAKFGYAKNEKTGEYELNAYVSAEVNAVLAEGNVSAEFSVAGIDMGAKVGVYIGAGARIKIGIEDGKFVFDISAALGIGFNLKFTIGFNEEFLKNIRYILAYPGIQYVDKNPYFKVDTSKLREYATRINNINVRLGRLDNDLRSLYWQVGLVDVMDIWVANLQASVSPTLTRVKRYLNNAADRFETADNKARVYMGG